MKTLTIYTQIMIHSQTLAIIVICYLTLSCEQTQYRVLVHEVTLFKFLYLNDPEACGKTFFYNYTVGEFGDYGVNTIIWTKRNEVAAAFRRKMALWVSVSVLWSLLALASLLAALRARRHLLLAGSMAGAGAAVLLVDLLHAALFLYDIPHARNEREIVRYVSGAQQGVGFLNPAVLSRRYQLLQDRADTTWLPLALAFCSARAGLLWLLNFWIVKDNYYLQIDARRPVKKKVTSVIV